MNTELEEMKGRFIGRGKLVLLLLASMVIPGVASADDSHLEAPPAAVRLRTAALLLSEQQGGELSMVSSVVRRPTQVEGEKGLEAMLTVELDDAPLRQALPAGGEVEAFVYLLDSRLEIFDSASANWQLPPAPTQSSAEPEGTEAATQQSAVGADGANATEDSDPEKSKDTGLDPVRFTLLVPAPSPGEYVFRILFRAGEHFGLRTLPLSIPALGDVVPTLMEAAMNDDQSAEGRWSSISPAGRSFDDSRGGAAFPILRSGSRVPLRFTSTASSAAELGTVHLELEQEGVVQRLAVMEPQVGSKGSLSGFFELPGDLQEGRYRVRLIADQARPSLASDVLVLDSSHPPIRWTELDRLKQQETTFSGEALRMPASERQRVITARRELLQVFVELERGLDPALARLRALETSLKQNLGQETIPFLRKQLAKIVGRMVRETRKRGEIRMSLVWLFMEHAEAHRAKGRHPLSQVAQNVALETLRVMAGEQAQKQDAVDGLVVLAGRMQRQRFLGPSEQLLLEAEALNPEHVEGLSALASVYERADRAKDAADILTRLVALQPDDGHSRIRLAVAHRRHGKFELALKQLDRVLQLSAAATSSGTGPWWAALAHQEKVRGYVDEGRLDKARAALRVGLTAFPDDPVLRLASPWLQSLKGNRADARRALIELPQAPDEMNARHRFHSWPRKGLDKLAREFDQRAAVASKDLATMARATLEGLK